MESEMLTAFCRQEKFIFITMNALFFCYDSIGSLYLLLQNTVSIVVLLNILCFLPYLKCL